MTFVVSPDGTGAAETGGIGGLWSRTVRFGELFGLRFWVVTGVAFDFFKSGRVPLRLSHSALVTLKLAAICKSAYFNGFKLWIEYIVVF
jgi:hypothetical protein